MVFEFPSYYSQPPFFTIQPVVETQARQLEMWRDLIISYTKDKAMTVMEVSKALEGELFNNASISRRLSQADSLVVMDFLVTTGYAEWLDDGKERALVMWRKPDEWANIIFNWVDSSGSTDTVFTVFDLLNGDDTEDEEFYGMEPEVMLRALKALEKSGRCQIFTGKETDETGVKFFQPK
eukprot:TRINITY_DN9382_c0_g1_i1.p1 TRINITY_DN9382_c0_g1~~TRINITY_DN9382_c0_g1_i1.p1  ORF type:complete len:180 (+),score=37.57 TRINITY_DN9382_c0_g1_i1:129-668(+)